MGLFSSGDKKPVSQRDRDPRVDEAYLLLNAGESTFAAAESASKSMARLFGLSSASAKYEEAAGYFQRAGNYFKLAKKWTQAGEAYRRCADCYARIKDHEHEAASAYVDAANCLKKPEADPSAAVTALESAMSIHTDRGRFGMAARLAKERAEILESIANETSTGGAAADERVAQAYQQAADLYLGEDARSHANACLIKVAEYKALAGDYAAAIQAFEQVAKLSLENSLLRYHAKDTLMRAAVCHLCASDEVGARRALQNYVQWDPSMGGSREERFVQELLEAVTTGDIDAFTQTVYDYDSISRLDPWKTSMLLRVKNQMRQAEEDLT
jgi:alpha-soluble NSF attachment protein